MLIIIDLEHAEVAVLKEMSEIHQREAEWTYSNIPKTGRKALGREQSKPAVAKRAFTKLLDALKEGVR